MSNEVRTSFEEAASCAEENAATAETELTRRVREVVEDIPPGCTMSYGDIGHLVGAGPRQIGRIMARASSDWPWWRVTRADGTLPADLQEAALERYAEEGTALRGRRVDRQRSRWDPWA